MVLGFGVAAGNDEAEVVEDGLLGLDCLALDRLLVVDFLAGFTGLKSSSSDDDDVARATSPAWKRRV